ncbi:tetratricopeptide repeat protein, partial [Nonomuraea sp. NN258]|uniref:AfsR/SARP family transcriptional regulator n=1 Tax=Nonomuraea antri TaxID=2730852 RepID=UPI00156A4792
MEFAILGTVRITGPEGRVQLSGKQRAVVAVLLLHANTTMSRERLIEAIWDDPPRSAPANVHTYVHQVRRALAGTTLRVRTEGSGYRCELPPDQLDLILFEDLARRARRERGRGDLEAAELAYAAAVALWRGNPLEDVQLGGALAPRLAELAERLAVIRSEWIDARLALGRDDLVAELRALVTAHPLRERTWEQLMIALYRSGRRDEALGTFREARTLLIDELGIEPGHDLSRLHAALLADDPVLDPRLLPAPPAFGPRRNPGSPALTFGSPQDPASPGVAFGSLPDPASPGGSRPASFGPAPGSDPGSAPAAKDGGPAAPAAFAVRERTPCRLPADTADFVGRTAELDALLPVMRAREDRGSPPIAVVSGLPGVGKTTFAVHLAHRLRPDYPDGQLFVRLRQDGSGPREPAELLDELLRSLGVDGTLIPGPVEERAGLLRQRLADLAVLVVLDDAHDETQLRHLLPGTGRGAVLVTSRSRLPALEGAVQLPLDLPGEDDARRLLEGVAGRDRISAAPEAAEEILRSCGRLPLAIRVAGARLATRPVWPVREFATRLADRGLDELVVGGLDVRATFEMSYAALPEPAGRAFRLLGLAGLDSVAEWTVAALLGVPALDADAALETLVARGMLDSTEIDAAGQPRYRLHDLLRVYARERAEAQEPPAARREALLRHAAECLARLRTATRHLPIAVAPPPAQPAPAQEPAATSGTPSTDRHGQPAGAAWLSAERRTLVLAVESAAALGQVGMAAELAHHLSSYLTMDGFIDDVERVQDAVIRTAEAAGDERAALRAGLLRANASISRGRYESTLEQCETMLAGFERIGDRHGSAYALITAAAARHGLGRLPEALHDAHRALNLLTELGDRPGLDYAWTWPIWIHIDQGDYDRAVEICHARLKELGDDDPVISANLLRALGTARYLGGEPAEAVAHYRESLLASEAIGDRVEVSKVLRRLGEALGALGRFDEAAEALAASLRLFGECGDRLGEALALHALGAVRLRQGRAGEAAGHLRTALDLLGPDGPAVWRKRTLDELARAESEHPT